tara:strand:- start:28 stop:213 length:186 start_codon:yes stop_codon:yes gene_type:complete
MAKKKSTPIINAKKKMKREDGVALGRIIGRNPLSDKVLKEANLKKKKNIEEIFIKKKSKSI